MSRMVDAVLSSFPRPGDSPAILQILLLSLAFVHAVLRCTLAPILGQTRMAPPLRPRRCGWFPRRHWDGLRSPFVSHLGFTKGWTTPFEERGTRLEWRTSRACLWERPNEPNSFPFPPIGRKGCGTQRRKERKGSIEKPPNVDEQSSV